MCKQKQLEIEFPDNEEIIDPNQLEIPFPDED